MSAAAPKPGPRLHRQHLHGATLLTLEDHSLPIVRTIVALPGGAISDPPGGAGTTRVMLDLLLRGTEQRDRQAFNASLEQLGSSLHALTGTAICVLRSVCLRRHLEATLELAAEALHQPALDEVEMTPLVDEIIESLRAERDDDDTLSEIYLRRALYAGHALERSPQGEIPELARLDVAAIRAAHAERVRSSGAILLLAGDVTPEEARAAVEPLLAGMPSEPTPRAAIPPINQPSGLRITVVDKPERTQSPLRLAWSVVDGSHPDAFAFWLGTVAFGGTFTAPFCREVRDVRGWSYTAHAEFDRRGLHASPIVLRSAPAAGDLLDCLALELDLYRDFADGKLEQGTVAFARTFLLNHYPLQVATAADMMVPALRNELLGLPPDELLAVPGRLEALDVDGVGPVVQRNLDANNLVVVLVATADSVVAGLRQRFPDAKVDVVDYRQGLHLEEKHA